MKEFLFQTITYASKHVIMPCKVTIHAISHSIKSLVPSYVCDVVHIDPSDKHYTIIYKGSEHGWNWTWAYNSTMYIPNDGYYVIKAWNSMNCEYDHYILNRKHLCEALGITIASNMWCLSDFGIICMLRIYMMQKNTTRMNAKSNVFAIVCNDDDVSHMLHPFMSSIVMERNITPVALRLLIAYLNCEEDAEDTNIKIFDYDLNEHTYDPNEFIVS